MRWFKKAVDRPAQKSIDELHSYWRNPDDANNPVTYLGTAERSDYLLSLVRKHIDVDASIMELGCNVGRNLNYLWQVGYRNLSGIEINEDAVKKMKENYVDMKATVYNGSIEERIKELGQYDLVFTMAVLEHIHKDSEWVFEQVARITKKYLITIEDEKEFSERHFPRNYRKIFEPFGLKQIYENNCADVHMLTTKFNARIFVK